MSLQIVPGTVHQKDDFPLDEVSLRALWRMEEGHFWHRARNRWILQALGRRGLGPGASFLEVGCGGGAVAGALQRAGFGVVGVETEEVLARKAHERCPEAHFVVSDVAALDATRYGPFQAIGFFDVLEHLDDPADLITASLRLAAPGALVVATVPARRALTTVIDDLSGHKRRFEPDELSDLYQQCGIERIEETGIFRATASLQRFSRRALSGIEVERLSPEDVQKIFIDSFRIPPWPINLAMDWLCRLEACIDTTSRSGASRIATGFTPLRRQ